MKKLILNSTMALFALLIVWSCDNGFADVDVIDTPPTLDLGSITSGTTEGEDFRIEIEVSDGIDGSSISALSNLNYSITRDGENVTSGSEELTGDNQTVTIEIPGGFEAGEYNLDVTVTDTNGNESSDNVSFTVSSATPAFDISGVWSLEPVAGSLKVGPAPGSSEWYQISDADVALRDCFYDDTYTFNTDGSFEIEMGESTWLETWQGVDADRCGTPVAPFDGAGTYSYTYTSTELTLIGEGAHVGLAKVNNEGEISQGAAVADQITYTIAEQTQDGDTRRMTLRIEAGDGVWWDFLLISGEAGEDPEPASDVAGDWQMEPVAGAFSVGPNPGSTEFFSSSADDVTTRACFFDDVYTFGADGSFSIEMGDQTWLESWQGVDSDSCGTPVAPHDGSGDYSFEFDGETLRLIGEGAHVALPKVVNGGELPNVDVPDDVTYQVASLTDEDGVRRMTLHIEIQDEIWWTFKLISE
ncbi:hypothetical protein [Algoriphagus hitonicola]|nr:hypothetical protein [Algoriphagus hitonicola]